MISEAEFQRGVEVAANAPGRQMRLQRINAGALMLPNRDGSLRRFRGAGKGTGDLVGYVVGEGWHIEVECKSEKGRSSEAQLLRQAAAAAQGWIYVKVVAGDELELSVRAALLAIDAAIARKRCPSILTRAEAVQAFGSELGNAVGELLEPSNVVPLRGRRK